MSAAPPALVSSSKSMSSQLISTGVLSTTDEDSLVIASRLAPEVDLVVDSEVMLLGYPVLRQSGQANKLRVQPYRLEYDTEQEHEARRSLHGIRPW